MSAPGRLEHWPIALYLVLVAVASAAAWFPAEAWWGLGFMHYLAPVWRIALIAAALVWLGVALWLTPGVQRRTSTDSTAQSLTLIPALVHIAVMVLLFVVLRAQAHYLGDGYTVLASLASETPIVKERALGEILVRLWTRDLFGGPGRPQLCCPFG